MYKWALIKENDHILSCLIDSMTDRTVEMHIDPAEDDALRIGDIVTARIDRIMHGLDAAFVDLPGGEKGYIAIKELDSSFFTRRGSADKYCQGDELLVQVKQEAIKGKAITVTGELSITDTQVVLGVSRKRGERSESGENVENPENVLKTGEQHPVYPALRISKKLGKEDREKLREYAASIIPDIFSSQACTSEPSESQCDTADLSSLVAMSHAETKTATSPTLFSREGSETSASPESSAQAGDNTLTSEGVSLSNRQAPPASWWVLLRTEAAQALTPLRQQLQSAYDTLSSLLSRASYLRFGAIHYRMPAPYLRRIKVFPAAELEKVITDDDKLFHEISLCISGRVGNGIGNGIADDTDSTAKRVEFYDDKLVSLRSLYRMTFRLEEATSKYVHLKSGGTLVIEHTEALHVIDVNTGKGSSAKRRADKEAELLKTNLEAAMEAARQIRLRNLSGIILIDFINMKSREDEAILLDALREAVNHDPVETKLVDMTRLGLVEITRKKVERPLYEALRNVGRNTDVS